MMLTQESDPPACALANWKQQTQCLQKQPQHHYCLQLNKQMSRYQAVFIPSETVQEATPVFLSSERHKQRRQWFTARWGDTSQQSCPQGWLFHYASTSSISEAGRILKPFPRVDRRIQGSGLTQWFWPKAAQEVRECPLLSTQSCTVVVLWWVKRWQSTKLRGLGGFFKAAARFSLCMTVISGSIVISNLFNFVFSHTRG